MNRCSNGNKVRILTDNLPHNHAPCRIKCLCLLITNKYFILKKNYISILVEAGMSNATICNMPFLSVIIVLRRTKMHKRNGTSLLFPWKLLISSRKAKLQCQWCFMMQLPMQCAVCHGAHQVAALITMLKINNLI